MVSRFLAERVEENNKKLKVKTQDRPETTRQTLRRGTGLQVVRTALKGAELSDVEDETVQRAAARTEMNK